MLTAGASPAERLTIFDLMLGSTATTLPRADEFVNFACGSNGGPPMRRLESWTDFNLCEPDRDGLREIYFEYSLDDKALARASEDDAANWQTGTQFEYFPIVASALFDNVGTLKALRLVTDPRPGQRNVPLLYQRPRGEHYLMRLHLMSAFSLEASGCRSLPMREDESPVLGMFERETCDWTRDGERIHIESVFVRRRGEADIEPDTGQLSEGQFDSVTRAEFRLLR